MSAWFKKAERLPTPDGVTVLAFWEPAEGGKVDGSNFATATYWEGRWHSPEDDEDEYAEPSHWMFIPALTAEGQAPT